MNVLLINSPYYYPNAWAIRTEPLGLGYLAAVLQRRGHAISVIDHTTSDPVRLKSGGYVYGAAETAIADHIRRVSPDVIGLSCHFANSREECYKLARLAKQLLPGVTVVVGGLFVSLYKKMVLEECPEIDFGIAGEAEQTIVELLDCLSAGSSECGPIDGLVSRDGDRIQVNKKKNFIEDIDSLPFPARDVVGSHRYMALKSVIFGLGSRPALSLLTSRSCHARCSYCNMWLVHGPRWRPRSPDNVLAELDEIVNNYHARHVFVMDDNLTCDIDRAKCICEGIIRQGYRIRWNTPNGISVKGMDAELASLMKRSGCANVCVGIESGSEYIRREVMKKDVSDEEIVTAIGHLHRAKLPVGGFIIVGMPEESEEHFRRTIDFVRRLPLSFITCSYATPFYGTRLYAQLVKQGLIERDVHVSADHFHTPSFETSLFSREDVVRRQSRLLLNFYLSHLPQMIEELACGRLTWLSSRVLIKGIREKLIGYP